MISVRRSFVRLFASKPNVVQSQGLNDKPYVEKIDLNKVDVKNIKGFYPVQAGTLITTDESMDVLTSDPMTRAPVVASIFEMVNDLKVDLSKLKQAAMFSRYLDGIVIMENYVLDKIGLRNKLGYLGFREKIQNATLSQIAFYWGYKSSEMCPNFRMIWDEELAQLQANCAEKVTTLDIDKLLDLSLQERNKSAHRLSHETIIRAPVAMPLLREEYEKKNGKGSCKWLPLAVKTVTGIEL